MRPKDQGTAFESAIVLAARGFGLIARRLAEGGSGDEGDVEVHDGCGRRWVIECKARSSLALHTAFAKSAGKVPSGDGHALMWKRLVWPSRAPGEPKPARRVAAGPALVSLTVPEFLTLLANQRDLPPP